MRPRRRGPRHSGPDADELWEKRPAAGAARDKTEPEGRMCLILINLALVLRCEPETLNPPCTRGCGRRRADHYLLKTDDTWPRRWSLDSIDNVRGRDGCGHLAGCGSSSVGQD